MRPIPNVPLRPTVNAIMGIAALAVVALFVFSVFGAPALEHADPGPLVTAGATVGVVIVAGLRLARSAGHSDLDRELRQLLEEEAGKPR